MVKQDKRKQIMQAAEALCTSRRFHEITLDEVAHAARVGKGTIYRYFEDKDDLFFQVVTSGLDELCELLSQKVPGDAPFQNQLLSVCKQITDFFSSRRQLFRMMQAEDGRMPWFKGDVKKRWMERHEKLNAALGSIISIGVKEGEIRDDIPPDILAEFLRSMLRTRAHKLQDAPEELRRHEVLVDLFCNGAQVVKK
ncbi:MAG: TetR/AcrR family transcriptional regulator [Planctomycetota bacterium]|nr:MAG: TetR/AcrR family transcriptional regulator [Planctomycetota bacterium]